MNNTEEKAHFPPLTIDEHEIITVALEYYKQRRFCTSPKEIDKLQNCIRENVTHGEVNEIPVERIEDIIDEWEDKIDESKRDSLLFDEYKIITDDKMVGALDVINDLGECIDD